MANVNSLASDIHAEICVLATELENMLGKVPLYSEECCIYKVPVNLRSVNEEAYTPKVISIGPLHHGEENLQAMETYKKQYLKNCLENNLSVTVVDLVTSLKGLEERVRNAYNVDQFPKSFSSNEFVTMMLLDGCFIVELFLLAGDKDFGISRDPNMFPTQYHHMNVYYDLMLLENQVPFFLLEHLYSVIGSSQSDGRSFLDYTFDYFSLHVEMGYGVVSHVKLEECYKSALPMRSPMSARPMRPPMSAPYMHPNPEKKHMRFKNKSVKVKHFVDFLLNCYMPAVRPLRSEDKERVTAHLPSATELNEFGIHFKKHESNNILDIQFTKGVLEIPTLRVDDHTEKMYRNMIAMEQCHRGTTSHITDYMMLMDFLVSTPNDVALLGSYGILHSYLGSDKEVCKVFNGMVKGVYRRIEESHYYDIIEKMNAHCDRQWNQWEAKLKRDYFNNPWSILSLIAALVLLVCTIAQVVYAALSYK